MAFKFSDIPDEVLFVLSLEISFEQSGIGYGSETIKKCNEIIEKYPEWFPKNKNKEIFPTTKQ